MGVAFTTQVAVFPFFGIEVPTSSHISLTVIFTVISILRGYAIRRLFNRVGK